ncbi:penicillin acylase family protein [Flavobacterium branchiophilum NBRC 15030 = ATCC 35035]|uniref:Penicillin amidase n=1 Tax=Flavobacterium branchiophilum TaxID=55197 RepID=A0A543G0N8_9FLAO|nr:penicillin acylase family protein [Flavobacterium branchiophilum]OXA77206.1 penicillin acylase family protein [Flavobacterium branchiophilum NBRC 15030 = ATCC 35035]TQM39615.1 penicillin amidase [Flavobacterium branchiophilum]GEM55731.1 penicillin amidase [Flavobacterium branchiophilum NBRC 15030 = ATCC 35035]
MKIIKKILAGLGIFTIIILLSLAALALYSSPDYKGNVELAHLTQKTDVYFDEFGVPHIYAQNQKDAFLALGYVHAQDRLWQMELLRRIAPGRLSEIFGSKALKTDRFFAGIGIDEASAKAIAKLNPNSESVILAKSYLDGINQYLENGKTPIEFKLLGIKKQQFELKDIYNIFGFMSFSFAMAQKTDPLLTDIRNQLGVNYLKDLGLDGAFHEVQLKNFEGQTKAYSEISKSLSILLDASPVPAFIGSNSWVIAPEKTQNNQVIFANDPHISFSQPATWYEAHLVTPNYEMYGYHLAGTPFPLLGHNRQYAYGLTMFENDDIDLYQETENPKNAATYQTPSGFENWTITKKIIKVKDSSDVVLNVKSSRHGPIMNGLLDGLSSSKPIAMSWIYTQQPIQILEATYQLGHAKNVLDFRNHVALIAAPGLNVMYGDAAGNISWTTSGKLYQHQKGVDSHFILDGASGKDDISTYLDFSKNPKALNPSWHYVYSANNQPEAIDGQLYPGYYLPKDRASRITSLLNNQTKWNKKQVSQMILDNTSATASGNIKLLLSKIPTQSQSEMVQKAMDILQKWDGNHDKESIAPTLYNKWVYQYMKNTFEDELGPEKFNLFMGTHIMKQVIATIPKNPKSPWWDNTKTKNKTETASEIINKSFIESIQLLEKQLGTNMENWKWKNVHTLEHQHAMGKVAVLKNIFNVGKFAMSGGNEVINNQIFSYTENGEYNITAGPSTRRVIDFSDIENSWSILPTGQSGNPMSEHYNDQAKMYAEGHFRKMKLNKTEIINSSSLLVCKPKQK